MEIVLKMTFDAEALKAAREGIQQRRSEIEILQKVISHYQGLCKHPGAKSYRERDGGSALYCEICGYDR